MARILIVEDEAIIAWEISRKLQQAGHTVVGIADSAEQALVTVQQHKPNFDLVLMDINLQGKQDGLAVAQEINNLLMLPILFVSGELNPEIEAQVAAVPHWSYLSKPFSTLVLQSTVGMILDQG